jgi:hypothetical protein
MCYSGRSWMVRAKRVDFKSLATYPFCLFRDLKDANVYNMRGDHEVVSQHTAVIFK